MSEPTVCAIMLTRDRLGMARRAVECFRAQTYKPRTMLVFDTSPRYAGFTPAKSTEGDWCETPWQPLGYLLYENHHELNPRSTIGELRNSANQTCIAREADILIHWDDDDYSHPNRIAEQVALLQSSGADCVGYREMLFWDTRGVDPRVLAGSGVPGSYYATCPVNGEAWLYSAQGPEPQLLGTSLCYWRKAWGRRLFEATSLGEDARFCAGLKCVGVTSIFDTWNDPYLEVAPIPKEFASGDKSPRMIARIHSGNTSTGYTEQNFRAAEWRRVPEWDKYCSERMEL